MTLLHLTTPIAWIAIDVFDTTNFDTSNTTNNGLIEY